MAPGNVTQRVDQLEEGLQGVRGSIEELQQNVSQQMKEQMLVLTEKMIELLNQNNLNLRATVTETIRNASGEETGRPPPGFETRPPGGTGGIPGGSNWRFRKLDMPLFDGNNPDGWILRAERYFSFYRLQEEDRMEAAIVAMEGDALLWYQWENRRHPIKSWTDLKTLILRRFRSIKAGSLYEQWLAVAQTSTVADYQRTFIEMSAPLEGITEEMALGHFVNGLKKEIKAEIRILGPQTLDQAMDLAVKIEEKLNPSQIKSSSGKPTVSTMWQSNRSNPLTFTQTGTQPANKTIGGGGNSKPIKEIRRLTEKELQDKKDKGLCFRCDEKWQVGHHCKRKELSIMLTLEDDDEPELEFEVENSEEQITEVCLNSVMGITKPKTMKMKGVLQGCEVIVMIDPGATHNFISLNIVEQLQVPVTNTGGFGVALGTEVTVQGEGECKAVKLQLQGLEVIEDFLPLTLGNNGQLRCDFGSSMVREARSCDY